MKTDMRDIRNIAKGIDEPVTEFILRRFEELKAEGQPPRTLFAACPNSFSVIKAALRAAKRNNAPIKFAATLNQVDGDGGYTGLTQKDFVRLIKMESEAINYEGVPIIAIDHGGPWLKDLQSKEQWDLEKAMSAIKKSFEDAVEAGYDLIHVDPTVDIFLGEGEVIDISVVAERTIELIKHVESFRKSRKLPRISYEVGTEEVHGGLANDEVFDSFLQLLKDGLNKNNLSDVWPCFIVGKVGTDLHTTEFDVDVASKLTAKVRPYGSYIKGHYSDDVTNPEDYPLCGMGAANVGPEFTISEYKALIELERIEKKLYNENRLALLSDIQSKLWQAVLDSNRWQKWLQPEERGKDFCQIPSERQQWIIMTCCRYIWQNPDVLVSRQLLYDNLSRNGYDAQEIVLSRIERDMDKYFTKFNLVNINNYL
ncbi:class II D-tagatose-bisphosphate aldolase non-catalytic subunit [Alkaliflexus imshenetskii]|uniref:class II D-tagatose-bisphosphate aldolase non-catalytic subunit n=1 Tax=Alkaliflexus imshenetskii TaxID=286730 RepID=UPI001C54E71F|nr:class II D-tagatose-bisphosphate aldolase, non-catalytic subunit [Alkaliflexus imshenetskii]